MIPRLTIPLAASAAILTAIVLAGCSVGGSATPGSGTSLAPSASASASPSPKAAAKTPFVIPSACLSASEVSTLLGLPEADPKTVAGSGMLLCEYLTATQDGSIIQYQTKPGVTVATIKGQAATPPEGSTATLIPGLADASFELKAADGGESILMLTGQTVIDVGCGQTTFERCQSLAIDVLAG